VTLDDLAQMVRKDKDFVVYDAKSGDDLTHAVLTQIIVEQESREGGQTLLPIPFLRQLIRFYDDNIGSMVPSYLQFSLENLVKEQEKFRTMFASAFSNPAAAFEAYQDQARKNMAMFEQAMSMFSPFGAAKPGAKPEGSPPKGEGAEAAATREKMASTKPPGSDAEAPESDELTAMRNELAAMQARIEKLAKTKT
jgi:polyhydroxyalkanoate synthesis repressor PhaR